MACINKQAESRIVLAMVGLPARGKSLISQKVVRYLLWLSIKAKCFNVGSYRREVNAHPPAEFFDALNPEGEQLRKSAAEAAVEDMLKWFKTENGVVGVLDATNSTKERRDWILSRCNSEALPVMFVESICDDEAVILHNIMDVKLKSPDYEGEDPEEAVIDFRKRITNYEKVYETIDEKDLTYVKLINVGTRIIISNVKDYLQSRIVYYLMNLHIKPRSIWLSRVS